MKYLLLLVLVIFSCSKKSKDDDLKTCYRCTFTPTGGLPVDPYRDTCLYKWESWVNLEFKKHEAGYVMNLYQCTEK